MKTLLLTRVSATLLMLLAVSVMIFVGAEILPGDPAQVALGQYATPEAVTALRQEMGLNDPAWQRYFKWLAGVMTGDWGASLTTKTPIAAMLSERVYNTALLASAASFIAAPVAIALGLVMAMSPGSLMDRALSMIVLAISAMPEFLIATIFVMLFAVRLGLLPAVSYIDPNSSLWSTMRHLTLPVLVLSAVLMAQISRMTRAIIVNISNETYIEMAELKGLPRRRIVAYHALINAVGPLSNVVALNVAYLVTGVLVVETVFAYPGLATLMINSVQARDMPVIQACALIFSATYVVFLLIADIAAWVGDPRAKAGLAREERR